MAIGKVSFLHQYRAREFTILHGCYSLWPSMQSVPNEFLELYYPLIIERYESIEDSGGPGFYRGGNGLRIHYRFLAHGEVGLHDDRWLTKVCFISHRFSTS